MRQLTRERVVVTLIEGGAFDGLLDEVDHRTLTLLDAQFLQPNKQPVKADGRVYLARDRVAYIQRP